METLGDHLEAALAWTLTGFVFGAWLFIKVGALEHNPEGTRALLNDAKRTTPVLDTGF